MCVDNGHPAGKQTPPTEPHRRTFDNAKLPYFFPPLTARFYGRNRRQIRGQILRIERLHFNRNQPFQRNAGIENAVRPVDHHTDADGLPAVFADDVQRLANAPALRDHVLHHQHLLPRRQLEASPQRQPILDFLDKDESQPQLPGRLLPDNQSSHRRREDRRRLQAAQLVGQRPAQPLNRRHFLKRQRALKKLPAPQSASQNKMPLQQGAGCPKMIQYVVLCHRANQTGGEPP